MRIAKFVVAFCTPQITVGPTVVKTKAYAIATEKRKAMDMLRAVEEACKKTNDFVPFHLRSKTCGSLLQVHLALHSGSIRRAPP